MTRISLPDNSCATFTIPSSQLKWLSELCRDWDSLRRENLLLSVPSEAAKGAADGDYLLRLESVKVEGESAVVGIRSGNLAGYVSSGDLELTVYSRCSKGLAKDCFLFYMLARTANLNLLDLHHSASSLACELNLCMMLFPAMLRKALQQGVFKKYTTFHYNDTRYNGALNAARHLRENQPFRGNVAYTKREYSANNHLTQLIRHTIDFIEQSGTFGKTLLSHQQASSDCSVIRGLTPNYCRADRPKVILQNRQEINHPYYSEYRELQKLCLRILRHDSLTYDEPTNKVKGIIINMAWLWEEYLNTLLARLKFQHPSNVQGRGRIFLASKGQLPRFPDFYRESENGNVVVDAKYKFEVKDRNDIHQIIAYMYRLKARLGAFVHVSRHAGNTDYSYDLMGHGAEIDAKLESYGMYIPQEWVDFKDFTAQIQKEEAALIQKFV